MFLPIFLLLCVCYFLIIFRKFRAHKITIKKFVLLIALIPIISFWDHVAAEVWASIWVNQATNSNICPKDRGRFFPFIYNITSDKICTYSSNVNYKKNLENYFIATQIKYMLFKNISSMEVDFPKLDAYYKFQKILNGNEKSCGDLADNYINDVSDKNLNLFAIDEYTYKLRKNCIFISNIENFTKGYDFEYLEEDVYVFGYRLFRKKIKRLINLKTGDLIYERRLAESDGGYFAKFILANPETGIFGRGFFIGSDR